MTFQPWNRVILPREWDARREEIPGWREDWVPGRSMCRCWEHEEDSGKKWEVEGPVWLGDHRERVLSWKPWEESVSRRVLHYKSSPFMNSLGSSFKRDLQNLTSDHHPQLQCTASPHQLPPRQLQKSSAALFASTLAPPGASFPLSRQSDSLQR